MEIFGGFHTANHGNIWFCHGFLLPSRGIALSPETGFLKPPCLKHVWSFAGFRRISALNRDMIAHIYLYTLYIYIMYIYIYYIIYYIYM